MSTYVNGSEAKGLYMQRNGQLVQIINEKPATGGGSSPPSLRRYKITDMRDENVKQTSAYPGDFVEFSRSSSCSVVVVSTGRIVPVAFENYKKQISVNNLSQGQTRAPEIETTVNFVMPSADVEIVLN